MTAILKIKRERIKKRSEDLFPGTELLDIETFTLEVTKISGSEEIYQGRILNENSSTVLITPEMDYDRCLEKLSTMVNSLGKVIRIDDSSEKDGFAAPLPKIMNDVIGKQ